MEKGEERWRCEPDGTKVLDEGAKGAADVAVCGGGMGASEGSGVSIGIAIEISVDSA